MSSSCGVKFGCAHMSEFGVVCHHQKGDRQEWPRLDDASRRGNSHPSPAKELHLHVERAATWPDLDEGLPGLHSVIRGVHKSGSRGPSATRIFSHIVGVSDTGWGCQGGVEGGVVRMGPLLTTHPS